MCGIIDDLLPVLGAVGGFFLGGPWGAAAGGALGGSIGNYSQTHNWGSAALGGVTGGVGGYFGGGSLANALEGLGNAGVGATSAAFDTGLAANTAPATLGGLESSAGGAGLFGSAAGTGTAIGSAAGALGGNGLGIAGGDALSGISGAGGAYLGGLGGGAQGTGLGVGGGANSTAALSGVNGSLGESGLATPATNQGVVTSPVSNLSQTPGGVGVTAGPTTSPMGSNVLEGSQAATTGSGAPMGYDTSAGASMEGAQAAANPAGQQGALAAMYGPNSTSAGSAIGQGIAGTQGEVPGASNVQFGALGEGTSSAPGMATGATHVGDDTSFLSQLFGGGQAGGQGGAMGQIAPWARLLSTGQGLYQQYAQQQAQNAYKNQINDIFSPTGAYAQQMQSNIARQYAAMGKNAEKGPQGVQLAAALAQAQAQALGGSNYYHAATATPMAQGLNALLYNFGSPQGTQQLVNLGQGAYNGLQNLFGG